MDIENDTYENVLIFNVLEHLTNIEIPLKEIHRILKINGYREIGKELDYNRNVRCIISTKIKFF